MHQGVHAQAVSHQIGDGGDLEIMDPGKGLQVRHAGHGAVILHDLADHAGGRQPCQAGQIHRALGLPGTHQDPALSGTQGEDMAGTDHVAGLDVGSRRHLDGAGPIRGGDTGGHSGAGLDTDRKGSLKGRLVVLHHHRQFEAVDLVRGHGQADQTTTMGGHEVDRLRGHHLGGHGQVALVLPVLVIHQDDHLAGPDILNRLFYGIDSHWYPS